MKAIVYDTYGPPEVLRLAEVERPVPREDEVLVKVHATTVNRSDVHIREANRRGGLAATWLSRMVSGLRRPRQPILGSEFAGEVAAAGAAVRSSRSVTGSSARRGSDSEHMRNSCAFGRAAESRTCRPA